MVPRQIWTVYSQLDPPLGSPPPNLYSFTLRVEVCTKVINNAEPSHCMIRTVLLIAWLQMWFEIVLMQEVSIDTQTFRPQWGLLFISLEPPVSVAWPCLEASSDSLWIYLIKIFKELLLFFCNPKWNVIKPVCAHLKRLPTNRCLALLSETMRELAFSVSSERFRVCGLE